VKLSPTELTTVAADVAWAFGIMDASGTKLRFDGPLKHGDLERLRRALDGVRPVASAPSIGEVLGLLRASDETTSRRARRRLVAELDALVAQGTHGRAKRQERKRIFAELVLLFDLEASLGLGPEAHAVDAAVLSVSRAAADLLRR
jgi:hypothetical protein